MLKKQKTASTKSKKTTSNSDYSNLYGSITESDALNFYRAAVEYYFSKKAMHSVKPTGTTSIIDDNSYTVTTYNPSENTITVKSRRSLGKTLYPKKEVPVEKVVAEEKKERVINETDELKKFKLSLRRHPVVFLKNFKDCPDKTAKDFILNFLRIYRNEFYTVREKDNLTVSGLGQMRSIHDMYGLVRFYIDRDYSPYKFLTELLELAAEGKIIGKWFCETIERYVFIPVDRYNALPSGAYTLRLTNQGTGSAVVSDKSVKMIDLVNALGFKESEFVMK